MRGLALPPFQNLGSNRLDPVQEARLDGVRVLALGHGHVGQHGQGLGLGPGPDEEQFHDGHDLLGVDAEGAIEHAAAAARAGVGGLLQLFDGRVVQRLGSAPAGQDAALGLEVFLEDAPHHLGPVRRRVPGQGMDAWAWQAGVQSPQREQVSR